MIENQQRLYAFEKDSVMLSTVVKTEPIESDSTIQQQEIQIVDFLPKAEVFEYSDAFEGDEPSNSGQLASNTIKLRPAWQGKTKYTQTRHYTKERETGESDQNSIFHCSFCSEAYKSKDSRSQHERLLHLNVGKLPCGVCSKVFSTERRRYVHNHNAHEQQSTRLAEAPKSDVKTEPCTDDEFNCDVFRHGKVAPKPVALEQSMANLKAALKAVTENGISIRSAAAPTIAYQSCCKKNCLGMLTIDEKNCFAKSSISAKQTS